MLVFSTRSVNNIPSTALGNACRWHLRHLLHGGAGGDVGPGIRDGDIGEELKSDQYRGGAAYSGNHTRRERCG